MNATAQLTATTGESAAHEIITVSPVADLLALGVQPGWFVKLGDCSIWFEVEKVWGNMLTCAGRDPKCPTILGLVGNFYSAIDAVCPVAPAYSRWIKLDRSKTFYDKFNPELDKILKSS